MHKIDAPFPDLEKENKRIKATRIILKSLMYSFAMFGFLFIVLLLAVLNLLKQDRVASVPVPKEAVLHIDFDNLYTEVRTDDLLSELAEIKSTSFYDLTKAINVARMDDRIKAITATISDNKLGIAQIQEVRRAVGYFRASGKKAYIHSTGFGDFGRGMGSYYLATAFDEIWMMPYTEVGITGIGIEVPFFRGLLDKIGVEPEFYSRYEYKTAAASMLHKGFDTPHKQELNRLGSDIFNIMLRDISHSRGINDTDLRKLIDRAPISSAEALEKNLISKISYKPEMVSKATDGEKLKVIELDDYVANIGENMNEKYPTIAFLVLDGIISEGKSENFAYGNSILGSETVAKQLEKIGKEKNLKALVIRVNSPGGSYNASQDIWYSIAKLKTDKKIPVVISMGDYAASGGYFVSLAGDYVYAEEGTITGSIGVVGGKIVLQELWKKLGVNWGEIKFGQNSMVLSSNHKFSKSEFEVFNRSLDNVYKDFTSKVSGARGIDLDTLDKYARGRVWIGKSAQEIGLVDGVGGIDAALSKAKELSGIESKAVFNIAYYPKKKTIQEKLADLIGGTKGGASVSMSVLNEIGLDKSEFSVLQRLKYDAILAPMIVSY